jgi:hypothetical protein
MAKTTDAPVAAPPERALFRCCHKMTLPDGSTANFGDTVDCTDWPRWQAVRSNVELQWLLPLNEAAQRLAFPGQFRERRSIPMPPPIPLNWCGKNFRGPTGLSVCCSQLAGHDGGCR